MLFKLPVPDSKTEEELTCALTPPVNNKGREKKRTLVILLHDFPSDDYSDIGNLFRDIEEHIASSGYHSFSFDYRGCGASSGFSEDFSFTSALKDIQTILEWAKNEDKFDHYVFIAAGISATFALMSMKQEDFKALILLWPVLAPAQWADSYFEAESYKDDFNTDGYTVINGSKIGFQFIKDLKETDLTAYLQNTTTPTLIQHGGKDKRVPVDQIDCARNHLNAKRLDITVYDTGEYGLAKAEQRSMVYYHAQQFLNKYVS